MNIDLAKLTANLSQQGSVILLDSQSYKHPWSRFSYLAAQPKAEIKAYGQEIHIIEDGQERIKEGNPWEILQAFRKKHESWLFGYLGYDLKNHIEKLDSRNTDPVGAPDLYFMVPDLVIEQNCESLQTKVLKGKVSGVENLLRDVDVKDHFTVERLRPQVARKDYLARIRSAQQSIKEGAFYEINLSHQLKGQFTGSPRALYQKMRKAGPVPFGAFLQVDDLTVCCQSPERFLRREGQLVFTQPIKGTAPRGKNAQKDQILKKQLAASLKERAENLMIVDLVRNDLSRIAHKGTVKVRDLFKIESFSTVHQMVSTVEAKAKETNPIKILKACFPMGSMTGAPKISAMEMIEELEGYRRGIYSGTIGYLKPDGDFDFNVVIRTAILKENSLFYSVGGAITGDSDPEKEWEETLVKARALTRI